MVKSIFFSQNSASTINLLRGVRLSISGGRLAELNALMDSAKEKSIWYECDPVQVFSKSSELSPMMTLEVNDEGRGKELRIKRFGDEGKSFIILTPDGAKPFVYDDVQRRTASTHRVNNFRKKK